MPPCLVYLPTVILSDAVDLFATHSNHRRCSVGDKSPKSKERQKKAAAIAKATPTPARPLEAGK